VKTSNPAVEQSSIPVISPISPRIITEWHCSRASSRLAQDSAAILRPSPKSIPRRRDMSNGAYGEILKRLYYEDQEELNNEIVRQVKAGRSIDAVIGDLESIVPNQETVQAIVWAAINIDWAKQEIRERREMIQKLFEE
jgi:hypothetical protein